MTNDRLINISVGASRKAINWQPAQMLVSGFYGKLQTPARSSETLAEYLAMKKTMQDDLKDIGGFVGGSLNSPRRKATNVSGRDLITLDADNIPAGQTNDIKLRVSGMGVNAVIYSIRKHHSTAPRLRVIFPIDRTVTADEYEPCARKMAKYLDPTMQIFDPTTFEVSRLMYWASCCSDSEYVFDAYDAPFVSADGLLAQYADWRDAPLWPRVPGENETIKKQVSKQQDPATKNGIVGAYNRIFDIYRAMEELISGIYEPVDNSPDRYTFTGGSTTGGAVVYDNGSFLFSHHATDPCGGKLVNAFDLVRLHKFADLDADAADGTFTHQLPSFKAMCDYAESIPEVKQLFIKERGEEIQRDFSGVSCDDVLAEYLGGLKGEIMTTGTIRGLLKSLGTTVRINEISRNAEITGCPPNWPDENAENLLPILLLDYLKLSGVKGANKNAICDCLDYIANENHYNPVAEMLKATAWDGRNRLIEDYQLLNVTDPFYQTLIFKWRLQCVALAFNNSKRPYGADGVLTLQGPQRIGKTSYFRETVPVTNLFKEGGADIDPRNKDTILQATSHWICELGEIDKLAWRDQASLKAFLTAGQDEYRTPYARKAIKPPRRTSFCGTVNPNTFLVDDTGNQRYWTVPVQKIDLDRLFALTEEWKMQLWAQVYQSYLWNPQGFRLTKEERTRLDQENQTHAKPMEYELEVRDMFNYDLPIEKWGSFTAVELAGRMMQRPPANRLGRVLAKLAREDERIQIKTVHKQGAYTLPIQKVHSPQ